MCQKFLETLQKVDCNGWRERSKDCETVGLKHFIEFESILSVSNIFRNIFVSEHQIIMFTQPVSWPAG